MKLLILLLVLVGCTKKEETIRYNDVVEVTKGFYQGCQGIVRSRTNYTGFTTLYEVELYSCPNKDQIYEPVHASADKLKVLERK